MSREPLPSLGFKEVLTNIEFEHFIAGMKPAQGAAEKEKERDRRFTIASSPLTSGARRRIVVLVHGSNTLGEWATRLEQHLATNAEGIDVRPVAFEPLQLWKVLVLPVSRARLRDIDSQICSIIDEMLSGDEISIVAHSYGTQLVMRWLNWRRGTKFKYVILLGSIVKRKWLARATARMDKIYNFVAVRDKVVCRAHAYAGWFYEATGTFGARQKIRNLYNYKVDADHAEIVTLKFLERFILPVIDGRGLPPQAEVAEPFDHTIIWAMRRPFLIPAAAVILLLLLGVYRLVIS